MMLDKIKSYVKDNEGVEHYFKFYGARNQNEEFKGTINGCYNQVFTITVENSGVRSFSYADLLTESLVIVK